ncbi:DUF1496 domain-containing protein [Pantoea sp. 1.19]|uniref:DUF1496 domain-containing protein n=1 Tax=Pantoea sp. 1.19 TaxID=1925589 RepID=UPI0009F94A91|nr:DUF1496 domain-containing protein [Pantoea sp. 1.19]
MIRQRAILLLLAPMTALAAPLSNTPPGVIVALPSDARGAETAAPPTCLRCCLFDNRLFSEGAVVTSAGVLLQCVRDTQTLGTNTLIWQRISAAPVP